MLRICKLIVKKYLWIVLIPIMVGIILLGIGMARTIYQAYHYTVPTVSSSGATGEEESKGSPGFDRYAVIFQRDLFASGLTRIEGGTTAKQSSPSTSKVPFWLKGTVVASPEGSLAIIEDPETKKQEFYRHDEVIKGYRIAEILRNKVVFEKDGREEVVEVVEEKEKPPPAPVTRPRRIQRRPVRRPIQQTPPAAQVPEAR